MAVVMEMLWSEASLAQYDESRDKVRWEQDVPDGAVFHVAWMGDDGLHVVDVWESEEACNRFGEVLGPLLQELGAGEEPEVYPAVALVSA